MESHKDPAYLKLLVEFTERAAKESPEMQEQLDRLKVEMAEAFVTPSPLVKPTKKRHK